MFSKTMKEISVCTPVDDAGQTIIRVGQLDSMIDVHPDQLEVLIVWMREAAKEVKRAEAMREE